MDKQTARFIKSLQQKKSRIKENLFVVEGKKNVLELINSTFKVNIIYALPTFISEHEIQIQSKNIKIEKVKGIEISSISFLKTNTIALAVAQIPERNQYEGNDNFVLTFENIQDPGNLGTIIRTADWYRFKNIVCSLNSVDCYNPKVIAATMGSFARVNVHYLDLEKFIMEQNIPVYGAFLSGENIHKVSFKEKGILLFGNESKGISDSIKKTITNRVTIKGYGKAKSLNVAIATAIFCDNLRRLQK